MERLKTTAILVLLAMLAGSVAWAATSGEAEVRITARQLEDGRVEFALQQRVDGEWGERQLPRSRFFPADAQVGRWLNSSAVNVEARTALPALSRGDSGRWRSEVARPLWDGTQNATLSLYSDSYEHEIKATCTDGSLSVRVYDNDRAVSLSADGGSTALIKWRYDNTTATQMGSWFQFLSYVYDYGSWLAHEGWLKGLVNHSTVSFELPATWDGADNPIFDVRGMSNAAAWPIISECGESTEHLSYSCPYEGYGSACP